MKRTNPGIFLTIVSLLIFGCGRSLEPVVSISSGNIAVVLAAEGGRLKSGSNSIELRFHSGNAPQDVQAPSLLLFMPAMGTMAEMRSQATLSPTGTPGVFSGSLVLEMKGTWKGLVEFTVGSEKHQTDFSVQAQ